MTRTVVVCDASVAIAWLLDERAPSWVVDLWDAALAADVDLQVPAFFWLEVGNRLVQQPETSDEQVLEGILRLEGVAIQTVDMDRSLRLMAIHLARRFALSAYDAFYLAVAETSGLALATLDRRLGTAATAAGRRYGDTSSATRGPKVHETSAAYGTARTAADPTSLAALGAYLAELRDAIPADG